MAALVHGTCVSLGGAGALLRGPPGAGKSDLALRFVLLSMAGLPPKALIADDQVVLQREGNRIMASPPLRLAGKIEVRGVGIVELPHCAPRAELQLLVDLNSEGEILRLPEPLVREDVLGLPLPCLALHPFEASAPLKLALAIQKFSSDIVD